MEIELTKSAKKSIALIYKEYLRRIENGQRKVDAKDFELDTHPDLVKAVDDDRQELSGHDFIKNYKRGFRLEDKAIVYMENKTADTIKSWLSFGAQFIP